MKYKLVVIELDEGAVIDLPEGHIIVRTYPVFLTHTGFGIVYLEPVVEEEK